MGRTELWKLSRTLPLLPRGNSGLQRARQAACRLGSPRPDGNLQEPEELTFDELTRLCAKIRPVPKKVAQQHRASSFALSAGAPRATSPAPTAPSNLASTHVSRPFKVQQLCRTSRKLKRKAVPGDDMLSPPTGEFRTRSKTTATPRRLEDLPAIDLYVQLPPLLLVRAPFATPIRKPAAPAQARLPSGQTPSWTPEQRT